MFDFSFFDPNLLAGMDPNLLAGQPIGLNIADAMPAAPDLATGWGSATAPWDAGAGGNDFAANVAAATARGNPFGLSDKDWNTFYTGLRSLGTGGAGGAAGAGGSPNSSNYMRSGHAAPASAGGPNNLLMSLLTMHQNNQAAAGPSSRGRMSLLGG